MIEILQIEDSTRQTLSEMSSTMQKINYVSYERRNPKVVRTNRNSKIILMVLILLLAVRNKILQVQASCATNARNPTPRDMKMSAKQGMSSVMGEVPLDITR